jgi:hypothetical protein
MNRNEVLVPPFTPLHHLPPPPPSAHLAVCLGVCVFPCLTVRWYCVVVWKWLYSGLSCVCWPVMTIFVS